MAQKIYYYTVSVIFFIITVLHLARIVYSWEAVIGGAVIPLWVSWAAVVIAGYLCIRGWMFAKSL
ncbi:MAG: hypothetical protein WDZ79_00580 [Candidatus Paceibacterota bacterium]